VLVDSPAVCSLDARFGSVDLLMNKFHFYIKIKKLYACTHFTFNNACARRPNCFGLYGMLGLKRYLDVDSDAFEQTERNPTDLVDHAQRG
jgi:hypothetical protein